MLEKRIYSPWAYMGNENEKYKMNQEIYQEIKNKAEVNCVGVTSRSKKYEVISNPHNLTPEELALICDSGNLCFGYRTEGRYIVVHTD